MKGFAWTWRNEGKDTHEHGCQNPCSQLKMKNYLKNRGNEKRNFQFIIQIKLGKMPITMLL